MKRIATLAVVLCLTVAAFAQTYTYKSAYGMNPYRGLRGPYAPLTISGSKGYGAVGAGMPVNAGLYQAELTGVSLKSECCSPDGGLTIDPSGNLYGLDAGIPEGQHIYGRVFAVKPGAKWEEADLYDFTGGDDGRVATADIGDPVALLLDASGDVWGTTAGGGANPCSNLNQLPGCGVVFELTNNQGAWTEQVIWNFSGPPDGANPLAGLTYDATSGSYYGTTTYGGEYNAGTVFELRPNGDGTWSENVVYSFGVSANFPQAGVTLDGQGNIYGTTYQSGSVGGFGTVYEISGGQFSVLHNFSGSPGDGESPTASLTFDQYGNLWGTTSQGGKNTCGDFTCGTLFYLSLSANGWQYTLFHNFSGLNQVPADGEFPQSNLALDELGNLWGTTTGGGCCRGGTIYEVEVTK